MYYLRLPLIAATKTSDELVALLQILDYLLNAHANFRMAELQSFVHIQVLRPDTFLMQHCGDLCLASQELLFKAKLNGEGLCSSKDEAVIIDVQKIDNSYIK